MKFPDIVTVNWLPKDVVLLSPVRVSPDISLLALSDPAAFRAWLDTCILISNVATEVGDGGLGTRSTASTETETQR